MTNLAPIIVGFLLTTVVGGLFGFLLQTRSWNHQHKVQIAEAEKQRAVQIFEEVSRLMDKRLYRLRLLRWGLLSDKESTHSPRTEESMTQYRAVLCEWNDGINRNLALLMRYFGVPIRDRLDYEIGALFADLGRVLEQRWKNPGTATMSETHMQQKLNQLSSAVYSMNLDMLRAIQMGSIGEPLQQRPARRRRWRQIGGSSS